MMPAGNYYIGDLCYVMNDVEWKEVCNLIFRGESIDEGEFTLSDGRRFAIYSTKYGDGVYSDQTGNEYSVDSGSLGCILFSDIKTQKYDDIQDLGVIHEFSTDFVTGGGRSFDKDWEGTIQFGRIVIETGFTDFDEEE